MGVTTHEAGAATVVTLRWPESRNAMGVPEAAELAEALRAASRTARGAVVLTGEGAFCAGGDLRAIIELSRTYTPEQIQEHVYTRFQELVRILRDSEVPTIAAVDGAAVGLGLDLALACDVRLVGPKGWAQQGWARVGLVAGTGGVGFLARQHPGVLWELLGREDRIGPPELARLGLGTATDGPAVDAAVERAERFARLERDVLTRYVRLDRAERWPTDEHFAECARIQGALIASERFRTLAERMLGITRA